MKALCGSCQAAAEDLTPSAAPSVLCSEFSQTRAPSARLLAQTLLPGTALLLEYLDCSQHRVGGVPAVRMESYPARDIKTKATVTQLRLLGNLARGTLGAPLQWMQGS